MSLIRKPTRRSQFQALLVIALFGWFSGSGVAQADSRLADAAMQRARPAVRALLAQKADANASSADGSSALLWLVRVDDLEMARLLIQAGADARRPNSYGVTPLYLARSNS